MRITNTTLRRIIKEELDAVMNEDRAEHVAGIEAKIKRLEAEIDRAQERRDEIGYDPAADDPRTSKTYRELGVRIENMEDKLDTLRKQREELSAMEEGRASETPAERKERIAAEKDAKAKADRARGSYYRHEPPNRPETYPGEFASRYMQEDAAMNEAAPKSTHRGKVKNKDGRVGMVSNTRKDKLGLMMTVVYRDGKTPKQETLYASDLEVA
jgi:DNA repair exonuclease SbcCD ATPase subunit